MCQLASAKIIYFFLPVSLSAWVCVRIRKKCSPYALTISSKGVFETLNTMVTSEFHQNVPFGRYEHFLGAEITMLPNTMKIESWVPQAMYNPSPPTFGRIDAKRGSSVEITKITDFTKRHENRSVCAPGHVQSNTTHIRSHRRVWRGCSVEINNSNLQRVGRK